MTNEEGVSQGKQVFAIWGFSCFIVVSVRIGCADGECLSHDLLVDET